MSLQEYKKKRDFSKTPEPDGDSRKKAVSSKSKPKRPRSKSPIFIVQKHQASRLHYDFRLEHEGALLSWAIPKEPVMDSTVKRLAVHVEDHPLSYAEFSGDIPEGEYGAGHIDIWDKGTYSLVGKTVEEGLRYGHIHVVLHGQKLKGEFSLIKFNTENKDTWLFFKNEEDHSLEAELKEGFDNVASGKVRRLLKKLDPPLGKPPKQMKPMLAKSVAEPFDSKDWLFELKYDGYRILSHVGKNIKLWSRNSADYTDSFPEIKSQLERLPGRLVLDGEIVVMDKQGRADFILLQKYLKDGTGNPAYLVFDLLHIDGYDLRKLSLENRKKLLKLIIPDLPNVLYSDHVSTKGRQLYSKAKKLGLEGIIAKKKDAIYSPGKRVDAWQKIKLTQSQDLYIAGYTRKRGTKRKSNDGFGALILARKEGRKFVYAGKVGTGFDDRLQKSLLERLAKLISSKPILDLPVRIKEPITWVQPDFKCEVTYTEITKSNLLRHPTFKRLIGQGSDSDSSEDTDIQEFVDASKPDDEMNVSIGGFELTLTNLSKVFWPEAGYTKGDMIDYYAKIAEYMLPYLKDRPMSLHRHPDGIDGFSFYQKDLLEHPKWVKTKALYSKSAERTIHYLIANNAASLIYMAQLGSIEIHPWHSRLGNLNKPDYMVIDLDPRDIEFAAVVETAKMIHKILDEAKVPNYCKTSGKKGLHIYVPLGGKYTYKQSLEFAKVVTAITNDQLPEITSKLRSPKDRPNKVYLDIYQNPRGQTIASAYSLRPAPGAPVSTPLRWSEVNSKLTPNKYHLKNIHRRLAKVGDLWDGLFSDSVDLKQAVSNLQKAYQ